jgi:dTDP-4-amino-4,6-dideoxygalactose transaminase
MSADAWSRFSGEGHTHYEVVYSGFKYNMTDIQAALSLVQLGRLESWLAHGEKIWGLYDSAFRNLPLFTPKPAEKDTVHARHLYTPMLDLDSTDLT